MLGAYLTLLRIPVFRGYCAITACATSMFFSFAAGRPVVVVQGLGHAPTTYAIAMMLISVGWRAAPSPRRGWSAGSAADAAAAGPW